MKKVSQRNAPGAISAIALIVRPPRPKVALVVGCFSVAISFSFYVRQVLKCIKNPLVLERRNAPKTKKAFEPTLGDRRLSASFRSALRCVEGKLIAENLRLVYDIFEDNFVPICEDFISKPLRLC